MLSKLLRSKGHVGPVLFNRLWSGQSANWTQSLAFLSSRTLANKGQTAPAVIIPIFQQKRYRNRYSGFPKPKPVKARTVIWYLIVGGGIFALTLTPL